MRGKARSGVVVLVALASASTLHAATLDCRTPESQSMRRHEIVQHIVNAEARRDAKGRIAAYRIPNGDGGGRFEVAGINERYHADMAAHLVEMIDAGQYQQAEAEAVAYIAAYTDRLASRAKTGALAFLLRDMAWNRGPTGAVRILQIALRITEDGGFGPRTQRALAWAERDPEKLIGALRVAREIYERRRRDEDSRFWRGLVNRWDAASDQARCYIKPAHSVP